MKENVGELSDISLIAKDLGVECLVYHPVIVAQDDMQNTSPQAPFWIREENINILQEQIDKIVEYKESNGLVAFLHDPYLLVEHFKGQVTKKQWKCNPFVFINIGPDGEVRSCGSSFGNIRNMTLEQCFNSEEAYRARNIMKDCQKPCLQTCWAHPESDSLTGVIAEFIGRLKNDKNKPQLIKKAIKLIETYEDIVINNKKNG